MLFSPPHDLQLCDFPGQDASPGSVAFYFTAVFKAGNLPEMIDFVPPGCRESGCKVSKG